MRNISSVIVVSFFLFAVLGCGSINPFSSEPSGSQNGKSTSDKAVDTAVGESRIGVPECDEVMDELTKEMNSPDDNFVTKAIKATVLNRIKDGIRESVEQNKSDKVEMAKTCKEFKAQLEKYKAEEEAKKNEK
jgi:hypothetical protein